MLWFIQPNILSGITLTVEGYSTQNIVGHNTNSWGLFNPIYCRALHQFLWVTQKIILLCITSLLWCPTINVGQWFSAKCPSLKCLSAICPATSDAPCLLRCTLFIRLYTLSAVSVLPCSPYVLSVASMLQEYTWGVILLWHY